MPFQVRMVSRTWKSGTPIERPVPGALTLRCVNIFIPGTPTCWLSSEWRFRYAWLFHTWKTGPLLFLDRKCTWWGLCMHRIYRGVPLVQESTRRLVLVRGRKQWATFINQPWRVALSAQIQTTIIPGEKMVVIHPERHPWLESGAESHLFHPMHKPGIFRHTLSYYMTTMEIRSFTYRFLCRNINNSQLFKYQCYKRNVGQLLYGFQNKC